MKPSVCGLSVALLAMAGVAGAGQPGGLPASQKSMMFYFSKPVGPSASGRHDPVSFGLRLQRGSPVALQRSVPLLDLRYRADGRKAVLGAGVLMLESFDSFESLRWGSSTGSSFRERPWLWGVAIGAGLVGAACALEVGICNGGGSDEYSPPTG